MKSNDLKALFLHQLQDLYCAETQQLQSLPAMLEAASHDELSFCLEEHLCETRGQITRLHRIAVLCEFHLGGYTCEAVKSLIAHNAKALGEDTEDHVRDSKIISTARRIVSYEVAAYTTARDLAKALGYTAVAKLLETSLREERLTGEELEEVSEWVLDEAGSVVG